MKNTLFYYYGISVTNIHQINRYYSFEYEKSRYRFVPTDRSIEEIKAIYELNKVLINRGIPCHEIILNNSGQIITFVNQSPYILLKIKVKDDDDIILSDIIYFQNSTKNIGNQTVLMRNNWYQLWTNKIDYLEYQVSQISKKYPIIRESFSYFIGLGEMAISLFSNINKSENVLSVSHKRIRFGDKLFDLYNPLNFIIDHSGRDASEYFKSLFINRKDIINEVIYYLNYSKLNNEELQLFFIRMIFPTFYFDCYDDVIDNKIKEKELLNIIAHINEYEILLRQIYFFLKQVISLPEIEMFNKGQYYY